LRLSDVSVVVDLDCISQEYKTPSVFVIKLEFVEFLLAVNRPFDTKMVTTTVDFSYIGSFSIDSFPNNAHTEIIASVLKISPLKDKLFKAISKWSVQLQKLTEVSSRMVKFPELCYYCP
jgi:hypothetical protein